MKVYIVHHVLSDVEGVFEDKCDAMALADACEEVYHDEFRITETELQSKSIKYSVGDKIKFTHETNEGEKLMRGLIFAYDFKANLYIVYVDIDNDAVRVKQDEIISKV